MNPAEHVRSGQAGELRRAFDQSFAAPARVAAEDRLSLIAIRLAGEQLMLRADQITGLAKRRQITPLRGRIPELLGITSLRGMLLPVFSLAALLGLAAGQECAWLALAGRESPLALAFEQFEGQIEVQRTSLSEESTPPRPHVRQLARIGSSVRAVIDVPSVVEVIRQAAELTRS